MTGDNIILPAVSNKVISLFDCVILRYSQAHGSDVIGHNEGHVVSGLRSIHLPMLTLASSIKRSRSLGAADMAAKHLVAEAAELGNFPLEVQDTISKAVEGESSFMSVTCKC